MNHSSRFKLNTLVSAIALASTGLSSVSYGGLMLEEVVVTAQKREQDAQDIGVAVSAFSGDQLKALGVTDASKLADMTSGVSINMEYGTAPTFTIRGVSVNDFSATTPPAAAVYMDGVYKASNVNSGPQMFDVARTEILKGPQGTLWGRNTTGGAVTITSVKPTQEAEGYVNLGVGTHGGQTIEAAYGTGLTDNLSTRVSVRKMDSDGHFDSTTHGEHGALDNFAGRVQFLYEADTFEGQLIVHYAEDQGEIEPTVALMFGGCSAAADIGVLTTGVPYKGNPEHPSCGNPDPFDDTVESDWNANKDNEFYGATLHLAFDITDDLSIKSITAFDHFKREDGLDFDGTATVFGRQVYQQDFDQVSQEVRLESQTENGFWLVGAYFDSSEMKDPAQLTPLDITYGDIDPTATSGSSSYFDGFGFDIENFLSTDTRAIFAHSEYDLTDSLTLVTGLRYEDESKTGTHSEWANADPETFAITPAPTRAGGVAFGGTDGVELDYSMSAWSYKLGLNYQASDNLLLYGSYAVGVKSGGLDNAFGGFNNDPYDEETLKAFEVGFKWDASAAVRFNGALYSYDYDDMQQRFSVYVTNDLGQQVGAEQLTNIENATIQGVDLELTLSPVDALEIMLTATYLDTEVKDDEVVSGFIDVDGDEVVTAVDTPVPMDGNALPYSPDLSATALARYTLDWDSGYNLSFQVSATYSSDHFISIENIPFEEQDYTKVGAHIALTAPDDVWSLSLTGTNLTDEIHAINGFPRGGGPGRGYFINAPRSGMLNFTYNFH